MRLVAPFSTTGATRRSSPEGSHRPARRPADPPENAARSTHHWQAGFARLLDRRIDVGHEPITQFEILLADRLDGGVVEFFRRGMIAGRLRIADLTRGPPPGQVQFPVAAMGTEQRTKRGKLEPARNSSPVYSWVGMKPPMSVPQKGIPLRPLLMPTETWVLSVSHREKHRPTRESGITLHAGIAVAVERIHPLAGPIICCPSKYMRMRASREEHRDRRPGRATIHLRRGRQRLVDRPVAADLAVGRPLVIRRSAGWQWRRGTGIMHRPCQSVPFQHHVQTIEKCIRMQLCDGLWRIREGARIPRELAVVVFHPLGQNPVPR